MEDFDLRKYLSENKLFEDDNSNLDKISQRIKKNIDKGFIKTHKPTEMGGKTYYRIEKDDPEFFKSFKYGAYAVEEAWSQIDNILNDLGLGVEDPTESSENISDILQQLSDAKLIHLEW